MTLSMGGVGSGAALTGVAAWPLDAMAGVGELGVEVGEDMAVE